MSNGVLGPSRMWRWSFAGAAATIPPRAEGAGHEAYVQREDRSNADTLSRSALEATALVLRRAHPVLSLRVRGMLTLPPALSAPAPLREHDRFGVGLDDGELERIVRILLDLEGAAMGPNGEPTEESTRLGALADQWFPCLERRLGADVVAAVSLR